jgi:uncharacterized protein RhaS with RHS repeats
MLLRTSFGLNGDLNTYAYVEGNPVRFVDPTELLTLPNNPSGLQGGWERDFGHKDPNGERWRHPSGDTVDWASGRPSLPGWRGKDHWHHNNGDDHLRPDDEVPDPKASCESPNRKRVMTTIGLGAAGYVGYRAVRMLPSLAPPLWWTIPGNLAVPRCKN